MSPKEKLPCQDCYVRGEFIFYFGNEESKRVCRQCRAASRSNSNNYTPPETPDEEIGFSPVYLKKNLADLGFPPYYYRDSEGNNCMKLPETYDEYCVARQQLASQLSFRNRK